VSSHGDRGLFRALAKSLVVLSDPLAWNSSRFYRDRAEPWYADVASGVDGLEAGDLREWCRALIDDPSSVQAYRRMLAADPAAEQSPAVRKLLSAAWLAERNTRISYEVGEGYSADIDDVTLESLLALPRWGVPGGARRGEAPDVTVVVPFRCRGEDLSRARNLVAGLISLSDQSLPRERYHVVVVESDTEPRWADPIKEFADEYLFARREGKFNKSWAVNVGVVNSGRQSDVICILDVDILCDRDFLARGLKRMDRDGSGAHLPYRNVSCMDPSSTSAAITGRCAARSSGIDASALRRFDLRRPPGFCVWVRADQFREIGGMDERYEGWGGEDNDFRYRVDHVTPLDHYDDPLFHMYHPAASELVNGEVANMQRIPPLSWSPTGPIGQLNGPRT